MSERGLPTVEGAPACPFVAFEDDRDGRALAPDHRHRCFAEPRPAPRAVAHQEAYCLSSAFAICPSFQDWARREAAAARTAAPSDHQPSPGTPAGDPIPLEEPAPPVVQAAPPEAEPSRTPAPAAAPAPIPAASASAPRRNPPRDWAAPPPWTGDDADAPVPIAPPAFLAAPASARSGSQWGSEARGLAGSQADRLAGPDPDVPVPGGTSAPHADDLDDAWAGAGVAAVAAAGTTGSRSQPSSRYDARSTGRRPPAARPIQPAPRSGSRDGRPQQDPAELFGPAWEKPRRYEAYPSLRTRIGLSGMGGIPRLGIAAIALVLAAAVLFFGGPMLLGIGTSDPGSAGVSPRPAATETVSASPEPTLPPAPTPKVYVVVKGDNMLKIATKNGVTVEAILAANPQIKNPNRIDIGDKITIPVPVAAEATDDTVQSSAEP